MSNDKLLGTDFIRLKNMLMIFERRYTKTNDESASIREVIKAIVHINNVSKMIGSKRIKLSEGMVIHIQNELVLALKELED
jgi:hypothetical protein